MKLNWSFLKFIIPIITVSYIVYRIINQDFANCHISSIIAFDVQTFSLLALATLLLLLNWGLESRKWFLLINSSEHISFKNAYKAVLTGVSVSLFLPFGVGEYLGRISFLQQKLSGVILTIVGSMTQLLVTLILGVIALLYLENPLVSMDNTRAILFTSIGLALGLILFIAIFPQFAQKIPVGKRIKRIIRLIRRVRDTNLLLKVQLLSLIRYSVFTFQYVLVFWAMDIDIPFLTLVLSIAIMYLSLTVIPVNQVLELGTARGIILFSLLAITANNDIDLECKVLVASFVIWIINIAIPAFIGGILLLLKPNK